MNSVANYEEKRFLSASDVAVLMDVSKSMAYKIIRNMNADLKKQEFLTVPGKVSKRYFETKVMM